MNDTGMYIGVIDFSVIIDKYYDMYPSFRIHYHGKRSYYLAHYYGIAEYLDDTIGLWIYDAFPTKK